MYQAGSSWSHTHSIYTLSKNGGRASESLIMAVPDADVRRRGKSNSQEDDETLDGEDIFW